MSQSLTANQLKEQHADAYQNLEKILSDLHKDNLERFMQLYGFVDVKHVINHYMKYVSEGDQLVLREPGGALYHWDTQKNEWVLKGSVFVN